ncbi:MAG: aminoacyl-tRNA hydrolase [Bdellovibrionota bacterium]
MNQNQFVIVGLGNPGKQYEDTRHNIGFMLIDEIAQEASASSAFQSKFNSFLVKTTWHGRDVILAKPQTFMNLSGESVRQILSYFKLTEQNLIVVFDDLDQAHGAVKMRIGGGHGGHNGIRSILEHTSNDKFCRVKIGIGKPLHKSATANWVLHKFSSEEYSLLKNESFPTAKNRILDFIQHSK